MAADKGKFIFRFIRGKLRAIKAKPSGSGALVKSTKSKAIKPDKILAPKKAGLFKRKASKFLSDTIAKGEARRKAAGFSGTFQPKKGESFRESLNRLKKENASVFAKDVTPRKGLLAKLFKKRKK